MDALARRLPFAVDDVAAAGEAFARWRAAPSPLTAEPVHLWAYLYVHRYFAGKLAREVRADPVSFDALTTQAFEQVLGHLGAVRDPQQFPAWVSVVCKNAFRSWLRRAPGTSSLPDDDELPDMATPSPDATPPEPHLVGLAVARAIEALPDFLREIARRRFVQQDDYERIAADLGHGVATVRAYAKRARDRLQADPGLVALYVA